MLIKSFEKLEETKLVLAGTSAGAMSMSLQMIAGGSVVDAMQKGNVKMARGCPISIKLS